ncbi:MAG TPA: hypothetical protein PLA13_04045, partial [Microbacteriaceae bacterium]|nr:hypothetical protein [Microbacteriaceae bacterium]
MAKKTSALPSDFGSSRLTHTSTASGFLSRTQTQTYVSSLRRDGVLVRIVVWWMRVWQAGATGVRRVWQWLTQTITTAGLLIVLAATAGL